MIVWYEVILGELDDHILELFVKKDVHVFDKIVLLVNNHNSFVQIVINLFEFFEFAMFALNKFDHLGDMSSEIKH